MKGTLPENTNKQKENPADTNICRVPPNIEGCVLLFSHSSGIMEDEKQGSCEGCGVPFWLVRRKIYARGNNEE